MKPVSSNVMKRKTSSKIFFPFLLLNVPVVVVITCESFFLGPMWDVHVGQPVGMCPGQER